MRAIFLTFFMFSFAAFSQENTQGDLAAFVENGDNFPSSYDLETSEEGKRLRLRVLSSFSQVSAESFSLTAAGIGIEGDYAFFPKGALSLGIAQALTYDDTLSSLFTSLSMHWRYAIFGNLFEKQTLHSFQKKNFLKSSRFTSQLFSVSLGLEQHFFNAASAIVPASGIGFGLLYERNIWFFQASLGLKYGFLAFRGKTMSLVTGVLGFNWMF